MSTPYTTLERFLEHWDGVRLVTLKLLESFTEHDLNYRLVEDWRSVGELFHHIGGHQFYACRGALLGRWEPEPGEPDANWNAHRARVMGSKEALRGWLVSVQGLVRSWAESAGEERLEGFRPDNPWHEGMRGWLLVQHAYQDEVHHRGELYAIARLLDREVPEVFAVEHPDYWEPRKWK
ncbi:DinB family protein [Calidithermus terrae]|uniref:DinB family protein n=1 Tax=Calidithermus terrae TaxID=1408545 RepID=UPI0014733173|nr:DinB family protein [Calidithermus terrae]